MRLQIKLIRNNMAQLVTTSMEKIMRKSLLSTLIASGLGLSLVGCGGSSSSTSEADPIADFIGQLDVPETYNFESRFISGEESARYSGQITRHVLIDDLNAVINSELADAKADGVNNQQGFLDELNAYFEDGTDVVGDNGLILTTTPPTQQDTYNEISTGKNLVGKLAGNDSVTDHKNWTGGDFEGWSADSPEALIKDWMGIIAANAADSNVRIDPVDGSENLKDYHTEDGLDLKQLVQKFLLGAVTFSQGTDDYLDDATDGKGLLTDNFNQAGSSPYTNLEHQYDEGFGYFGAARDYLAYTDEEIAGKGGRPDFSAGYHDTDGNGQIDLNGEYNFGNSTNAAKRDLGSTTDTDFTRQAMEAFLTGRTIIAEAGEDGDGDLTDLEMEALKATRDIAVSAWEKAVAATAVHYINDVLGDMDAADAGDGSYSYVDHTKHWAELKGFALGLQFNPRSPLNEGTRFVDFHDLVAERPALPGDADFDAYREHLLDARALMQEAYDFAQSDVENW
jgi:hypothetical protein